MLDGTRLESIDEEKDLGLLKTCQLDWNESIYACIKDACIEQCPWAL